MSDFVPNRPNYVSKEKAADVLKAENGEDFMQFLGFNPLQNVQ